MDTMIIDVLTPDARETSNLTVTTYSAVTPPVQCRLARRIAQRPRRPRRTMPSPRSSRPNPTPLSPRTQPPRWRPTLGPTWPSGPAWTSSTARDPSRSRQRSFFGTRRPCVVCPRRHPFAASSDARRLDPYGRRAVDGHGGGTMRRASDLDQAPPRGADHARDHGAHGRVPRTLGCLGLATRALVGDNWHGGGRWVLGRDLSSMPPTR